MKIFLHISIYLLINITAGCKNQTSNKTVHYGIVSNSSHFQNGIYDSFKNQCSELSLPESTLKEIINSASEVEKSFAFKKKNLTPCYFEGTFKHRGVSVNFIFYPSGFLSLTYPSDEDLLDQYFLCESDCHFFEDWKYE